MSTFGISTGSNIDNPTVITTIVTDAPSLLPNHVAPLLGQDSRRSLSGTTRRDGGIQHEWHWDFMRWTDYTALINMIWGGASIASAAATIRTQDELNRWSLFNCKAERPYFGETIDAINQGTWVRDLRVVFFDLVHLGALFELETTSDFLLLETGDLLLLETS
jgi:hypothetical protein